MNNELAAFSRAVAKVDESQEFSGFLSVSPFHGVRFLIRTAVPRFFGAISDVTQTNCFG